MIIDVSYKRTSIEEFCYQMQYEFAEFCNEVSMDFLMDKYNYLQENGVPMLPAGEKASLKERIKAFVEKMVATAKRIVDKFVEKVKEKIYQLKNKINEEKAWRREKEFESFADRATRALYEIDKNSPAFNDVQDAAAFFRDRMDRFTDDMKTEYKNAIIDLTSDEFRVIEDDED